MKEPVGDTLLRRPAVCPDSGRSSVLPPMPRAANTMKLSEHIHFSIAAALLLMGLDTQAIAQTQSEAPPAKKKAAPLAPAASTPAAPAVVPAVAVPAGVQPPISWQTGASLNGGQAGPQTPGTWQGVGSLNRQTTAGPAPAFAPAPSRPGVAAPLASARLPSADAAARLRAAGFDQSDPRLHERLAARLSSVHALTPAPKAAPAAGQLPAYLEAKLNLLPQIDRQRLTAVSSAATAGAPAGSLGRVPTLGGPSGANLRPMQLQNFQKLAPTGLFDITPQQDLRAGPVLFPWFYMLTFNLPDVSSLPSVANLHLTIPGCQVNAAGTAYVDRLDNEWVLGQSGPQVPPPPPDSNALAKFVPWDAQNLALISLQLGSAAHQGVLTVAWRNYLIELDSTFVAPPVTESHALTIGAAPPFFSTSNELNLVAAAFNFANPAVSRLNNTNAPIEGYDIIGAAVALGPGYVASAQVVSAASVLDIGGDTSPDNQYRGAVVSTQPGANRLETIVHWHLNPYESLQYQIEWQFTGPLGQRPVMSLPLRGPCDS